MFVRDRTNNRWIHIGITSNGDVIIGATIIPDSKHISASGQLFAVAKYATGFDNIWMLKDAGIHNGHRWLSWNGNMQNLTPAAYRSQFIRNESLILYDGYLGGLRGSLQFFSGYRVAGDDVIFNNVPIILQNDIL